MKKIKLLSSIILILISNLMAFAQNVAYNIIATPQSDGTVTISTDSPNYPYMSETVIIKITKNGTFERQIELPINYIDETFSTNVGDLELGASYTFTLTYNSTNVTYDESSESNTVTPSTIPGVPTNINATASNTTATISFDAPISNGGQTITSYIVSSDFGSFTAIGSSSPITITGLTNYNLYTFTVKAINLNGESANSTSSNQVMPCFANNIATNSTPVCGSGNVTINLIFNDRKNVPVEPIYTWFNDQNEAIETGTSFTTPTISQTTTYSFSSTYLGCETEKKFVDAVVNPIPAKPYIAQPEAKCDSGSFLLHAEIPAFRKADCRNCGDNNTYEWRDGNRNIVFNDADFQTPMLYEYAYYLVTATLNGCTSDTSYVDANIQQTPTITVTEPNAVCDSASFVLSANRLVRKNCRGNCDPNSYEWRDVYNNNNIVSDEADFTTPMLYNNHLYTVTATYGNCTSAPYDVNVIVATAYPPMPMDSAICGEGKAKLYLNLTRKAKKQAGCIDCYDFIWTDANNSVIGNGESIYSPIISENTSYFVQSTVYGCTSEKVEVVAHVGNKPVITKSPSNVDICNQGENTFMVDASGEDLNYLWFALANKQVVQSEVGDNSISINLDSEMNGIEIGTIVSNSCGVDTSDLALITVHSFDLSVSTVLNELIANQSDASYQWINCSDKSIIEGANSQSFNPTFSGEFAVIVTTTSCSDTSDCQNLTVTGLEKNTSASFSVFPNPASDIVNINLTEAISGTVSITDTHGNLVVSKEVNGSQLNISTSDISSGVYVLKIASETLNTSKQVVIVK